MLLDVRNFNISILHEFLEIGKCNDHIYVLLVSPLFSHLEN
jgi:hypothetical protein